MLFKSHLTVSIIITTLLFSSINILFGYDAVHEKKYIPTGSDYKDMYFFNNELYLVSYSKAFSDDATYSNSKFILGSDGKISDDGKTLVDIRAKNSGGRGATTAVYKGVVYFFYDVTYVKSDNTFKIYYKTSSKPDSGWLPSDDSGFETGITADCLGGNACFKAVVFNDLLYLFYWDKDDGIHYRYYNGFKWSKDFFLHTDKRNDMVNQFFFAEPVIIKNKAYICIGLIYKSDPKEMQLVYLDSNGKTTEGPVIKSFTARAKTNNYISAAAGSLGGDHQENGNMLQIFAYNCAAFDSNIVMREVNLDSGEVSPWRDTSMIADWSRTIEPLPVTTAAVGLGKKNFRQYIMVLYRESDTSGRYLYSYESDYLHMKRESQVVNTENERGCWNLLGVVEGCPPFTRNSIEGENRTSTITYGYSQSQNVTFETTYGVSISLKATLEGEEVTIGGKAKQEFAVCNGSSTTTTYSMTMPLDNSYGNKNGVKGWLLYAKPSLRSRTYQKFAQKEKDIKHATPLCVYTVVIVESVAYTFEPYSLKNPPAGMLKRSPSSDLESWAENVPLENVNFINTSSINPLTVNLYGQESCSSKLSFQKSKTSSGSYETTITISGEATIDELFKLETENDIKLAFETSTTSTWGKSVEAVLTLSPQEKGTEGVVSMQVKPLWYIAKDDVYLSDFKERPYWIPNSHVNAAQSVPWCVSWVVTSIKKGKYTGEKNL